jgi:hypothetical protein
MDRKDEWNDECSWPYRLLHAGTLTSYEWQPGNTYGGVVEPRYNAISYTWGRFTLKDGEEPNINAMPIQGIPWTKDLPRIQPGRFTIEDMYQVIKTAVCSAPNRPACANEYTAFLIRNACGRPGR